MPSVCVFELNKENATYFSGETITGAVILKTTSEKNVRDVSIIFIGEGKVKWEETDSTTNSNGSTSTSTTYFTSHDMYVNNSTSVHGGGILPPGTYTYTFVIPLPLECPTSCEGRYGHIRYELSLKINRYFRFDNVYKKPISVIKTVDLNLNPYYKRPLIMETVSRSSCCFPCLSKGKIYYTLKIPFGAYAPGQKVKYKLEVANQSMDDTEGVHVELCQKIIFTARSPYNKTKVSNGVLSSGFSDEKCLRLSNRIIEGDLLIPPTPPSTESSSIISVAYTIKVTVHSSGCRSKAELKVPIIIGTVPIAEILTTDQVLKPAQPQQVLPTAPEMTDEEAEIVETNMPPGYSDLKPPTFEEAVRRNSPAFIDTDVDERNRIDVFRPRYPVYQTELYEKK